MPASKRKSRFLAFLMVLNEQTAALVCEALPRVTKTAVLRHRQVHLVLPLLCAWQQHRILAIERSKSKWPAACQPLGNLTFWGEDLQWKYKQNSPGWMPYLWLSNPWLPQNVADVGFIQSKHVTYILPHGEHRQNDNPKEPSEAVWGKNLTVDSQKRFQRLLYELLGLFPEQLKDWGLCQFRVWCDLARTIRRIPEGFLWKVLRLKSQVPTNDWRVLKKAPESGSNKVGGCSLFEEGSTRRVSLKAEEGSTRRVSLKVEGSSKDWKLQKKFQNGCNSI